MRIPIRTESLIPPDSIDLDKPTADEKQNIEKVRMELEAQIDASVVAARKAYDSKVPTNINNSFIESLELYSKYITRKMDKLSVISNFIQFYKVLLLETISTPDHYDVIEQAYELITTLSENYKVLTPEFVKYISVSTNIQRLDSIGAALYFQSLAPKKLAHVPWIVSFDFDLCFYAKTDKKVFPSKTFPAEKLNSLFNEYKDILMKQGFETRIIVEESSDKLLYSILIPQIDAERFIPILDQFKSTAIIDNIPTHSKHGYSERVANLIKIGADLIPQAKQDMQSYTDYKCLLGPGDIRDIKEEEFASEKSIILDTVSKHEQAYQKIKTLAALHNFKPRWCSLFFNNNELLYRAAASKHTKYIGQVEITIFTVIAMVKAKIFPDMISRFELFSIESTSRLNKVELAKESAQVGIGEAFIVFDRDTKTDPTNVLTWNKDAVILNPCLNKCLPVHEYTKDPHVLRYRMLSAFPKKALIGSKNFVTFDLSNLNKSLVEQMENDLAKVLNWLDPKAYPIKSPATSAFVNPSTIAGSGLSKKNKKKRKKKTGKKVAIVEAKLN